MNKYLEKIALDTLSVFGFENLYHGTNKTNAEKIRKEGLDPRKGGTGESHNTASDARNKYYNNSVNKVHVTSNRRIAKNYASASHYGLGESELNYKRHALKEALPEAGEILHARVPVGIFNKLKRDPDGLSSYTTHHKVPPSVFKDSFNDKVFSQARIRKHFSNPHNMEKALEHAGKPIIGDMITGDAPPETFIKDLKDIKRNFKEVSRGIRSSSAPKEYKNTLLKHIIRHIRGNSKYLLR